MTKKKGHIYFIMGVSGAGKGTLIKGLRKQNLDLYIPLSYKSRKPRNFEKHGIDSYFITNKEFEESIKNNEFLEYAIVHGKNYYGTKYDDVIKNGINKGKIVIKELDILGLKRLIKSKIKLNENYSTIFLNIPINRLRSRIAKRGEKITEIELKSREKSAIMEEIEAKKYCDYMLDATQNPEKVLKEVLNIIK